MDKKFFLYHCVKSIKKDNLMLKLQSGIMGRGDVSHGVVRAIKAASVDEVGINFKLFSLIVHIITLAHGFMRERNLKQKQYLNHINIVNSFT